MTTDSASAVMFAGVFGRDQRVRQLATARFDGFPEGTVRFLHGLAKNNSKTWFAAHRTEYDSFYVEAAKRFVESIGPRQPAPDIHGSSSAAEAMVVHHNGNIAAGAAMLPRATRPPRTTRPATSQGAFPSGKTFDVTDSTAREERDAAKELREEGDRSSSGRKGKTGMSTPAEERRVAAEAEAALHAAGLKRARVRAVARPGKVGDLRIEGIPTSGMGRLCKALCGRRGK